MTTAPNTPERTARPALRQAVLTVLETTEISPDLVRIRLGGDDSFDNINSNDATDKYVKLLFADPAHELVPPYDLTELREQSPEKLPSRRTYTVREIDLEEKWLTIDFVIHGADGIAGPWAKNAKPGDTLVLSGAGGKYAPAAESDWHLLIADLSAIPAVSSALEAMPEGARGVVLANVDTADRVLPEVPAGIEMKWVDSDDELIAAVRDLNWLEGTPQVFAHGERETIKAVRKILKDREVPRESLSISAYWARGRAEDQFQAEKREPIGQID
ncbi:MULTISPECIES: siderophore-interacting protein [unclassified Brevibacterium]|uniref:siderophore-interacting protein n=1 Tax=unclassified Brevibacterium TaxID=2614124 RepID=UPI001092B14F|nr:siderophore-interacting protein [Brevibacterium sp. S22]TGD31785.1 siderophore-interacting protein [Brevibacterium sp. S22]